MATLIQQLQAMRNLTENWDGYGAAVPNGEVIELAEELVGFIDTLLKKRSVGPCDLHVNPTRTGGVLIEWENAVMQHEVEISPDGSFSFLHLTKANGHIETRKLFPSGHAVVLPGFLHELLQSLAA